MGINRNVEYIKQEIKKKKVAEYRKIKYLYGVNGHPDYAKYGDVIYVVRHKGTYRHFGIYAGHDRVIHYCKCNGKNIISETSMSHFLKGNNRFYVCKFPRNYGKPGIIEISLFKGAKSFRTPKSILHYYFLCKVIRVPVIGLPLIGVATGQKAIQYHKYTSDETVSRARMCIGENKYSLPVNNCEHFAIWCKTGIRESHQVNRLLELKLPMCYGTEIF